MSINQINYELLFEDIAGFYKVIGVNSSKNRNKNALEAYWNIGNRIASMEKSVSRSEIYGKEVVKRLSQDLNKKFGTGFGMRNIFYMRSLARDYDKNNLNPELTWNHYKLLLMVDDTEQRTLLEKMTAEQHVTTKKLAQLIKQVSRGDKLFDGNIFLLHPREARTGIYKVVRDYKGNVLLDLGFNVLQKTKITGVRGLKQGEYIECVDGGQQYNRVVCGIGERYCYKGHVTKVIDGDTLLVRVELGFDVFVDQRLRLRGVDADELLLPRGKKAAQFVKRKMNEDMEITVMTYSQDIYGRYIADIIYKDGVYFNKEIVESGIAVFLDTDS